MDTQKTAFEATKTEIAVDVVCVGRRAVVRVAKPDPQAVLAPQRQVPIHNPRKTESESSAQTWLARSYS